MNDLKLYLINSTTFIVSIIPNIDTFLKVILLVVSIAYTIQRMYLNYKNNNK